MTSAPAVPRTAAGADPIPARRVLPARVTWAYLAAGAVPVTLIAAGPIWLQTPMILVVVTAGLTALHLGVRRNAVPGARTPWLLILSACWLFIAAMVSRLVFPQSSASPPNNWALIPDAFVIPAYLLMGIAYAGMLRRRRATEDDPARVDALLIGLATAFLTWTFLIAPTVEQYELTAPRLVSAFLPANDVVLMVVSVQLGLAGSARKPALWLLMAASSLLFTGDFLFALRDSGLTTIPQLYADTVFMAAFLVIGATLLHPSMRTLTDPQRVETRDLGPLRIATLAAMMVVPALVAALGPRTTLANDLVRAALLVALVLAVLARVVRSNNSRVRAERAARHRATHDPLTELPNRELLTATITAWGAAAAADRQEISLLFIDLDRFKWVNDHWGHQVGDELLCLVADRLGARVRAGDLVCRIGGDEFVIALAGASHSKLAESLAPRVLEELNRPFELSVGTVMISASIGVAKADGGARALELIRDADTAMYKAKRNGRNSYAMFDTSLRDQVRERVNLEQALRGALGNGELAVHFQPIHDLVGDELSGYEALMRWTNPELGVVSPVDFIPVAEETGLIVESGAWLLRESARQLAHWTRVRRPDERQLHVSVNVSVRQLRDLALVDVVRGALAETGLPGSALWLEITESAVMEDIDTALVTLGALRDLGVVLCIDDFGTGYSSLSYLHRLPVGVVKIDRAFVAGVGEETANEPIVRAVLAMTHAMGHQVVAEGVETQTQRDWLRDQGCDMAQGWLYGRPEPALRPGASATGRRT